MENLSIESNRHSAGVNGFRDFLAAIIQREGGKDENVARINLKEIDEKEKRIFDIFIFNVRSIKNKLESEEKVVNISEEADNLTALGEEIHDKPSFFYQWMKNRIGSVLAAVEIDDVVFLKGILAEQPGL